MKHIFLFAHKQRKTLYLLQVWHFSRHINTCYTPRKKMVYQVYEPKNHCNAQHILKLAIIPMIIVIDIFITL